MSQKSIETETTSTTKTQKQIWDEWQAPETLKECVKMFFEILDAKEYSETSGRMFHPNKFNAEERVINSCRVWDTHRLGKIMTKMKELSK